MNRKEYFLEILNKFNNKDFKIELNHNSVFLQVKLSIVKEFLKEIRYECNLDLREFDSAGGYFTFNTFYYNENIDNDMKAFAKALEEFKKQS